MALKKSPLFYFYLTPTPTTSLQHTHTHTHRQSHIEVGLGVGVTCGGGGGWAGQRAGSYGGGGQVNASVNVVSIARVWVRSSVSMNALAQ